MNLEFFLTSLEFRAWLEKNHEKETELWLGFYKKDSGKQGITYAQALDEALCFGWIDGLLATHDESSFKRRFTPRKSRSGWSKINVGHVERLTAEGRMRPAGLVQVEAAKADGRWESAYKSQKTIAVPSDLQDFLDAHPKEAEFFSGLTSSNRYAFLYRLETAKKPETRAKRLQDILKMLEDGKSFYP